MKWLNEVTRVVASCEQLRPVIENGVMVRGLFNLKGEFIRQANGPEILHEPIPGQVLVADDDPRILELHRDKTPDEQADAAMNSPIIKAVLAAVNGNGAVQARVRDALKQAYSQNLSAEVKKI